MTAIGVSHLYGSVNDPQSEPRMRALRHALDSNQDGSIDEQDALTAVYGDVLDAAEQDSVLTAFCRSTIAAFQGGSLNLAGRDYNFRLLSDAGFVCASVPDRRFQVSDHAGQLSVTGARAVVVPDKLVLGDPAADTALAVYTEWWSRQHKQDDFLAANHDAVNRYRDVRLADGAPAQIERPVPTMGPDHSASYNPEFNAALLWNGRVSDAHQRLAQYYAGTIKLTIDEEHALQNLVAAGQRQDLVDHYRTLADESPVWGRLYFWLASAQNPASALNLIAGWHMPSGAASGMRGAPALERFTPLTSAGGGGAAPRYAVARHAGQSYLLDREGVGGAGSRRAIRDEDAEALISGRARADVIQGKPEFYHNPMRVRPFPEDRLGGGAPDPIGQRLAAAAGRVAPRPEDAEPATDAAQHMSSYKPGYFQSVRSAMLAEPVKLPRDDDVTRFAAEFLTAVSQQPEPAFLAFVNDCLSVGGRMPMAMIRNTGLQDVGVASSSVMPGKTRYFLSGWVKDPITGLSREVAITLAVNADRVLINPPIIYDLHTYPTPPPIDGRVYYREQYPITLPYTQNDYLKLMQH